MPHQALAQAQPHGRRFLVLLACEDEVVGDPENVQELLDDRRVVRGVAAPDATGIGLRGDRALQGG